MIFPKTFRLAIVTALLCGIFVPGSAFAAPSEFRYQAELNTEGIQGSYALVEILDEVLDNAAEDYSDIRILAGKEEVPYALAPTYVPRESSIISPLISNLGTDDKGNTSFVVQLSPLENPLRKSLEQYPLTNKLQILTKDKNYVRKVKVESAFQQTPDVSGEWTTLQTGATIFDLSAEGKGSNTDVLYSQTQQGLLRVTIFNEGQSPLKIDSVKVQLGYAISPKFLATAKLRPHSLESKGRAQGQDIFVVDLLKKNLPTRSLEVKTTSQNFNRRISLEGSNEGDKWTVITNNEIYSYDLDKIKSAKLLLEFPSVKYRYLRVKINSGDDQPLKIQDVEVNGFNPLLVMDFDQVKSYTMYWGKNNSSAPIYDIEKIKSLLNYDAMNIVEVGAVQLNKSYQATDNRPWTERNGWLLQVVLGFLILILIGIIIASFRKIKLKT